MTATIIFCLIGLFAIVTLIKHPTLLIVGAIMLVIGLLFGKLAVGLGAFGVMVVIVMFFKLIPTQTKEQQAAHTKSMKEQQLAQQRLQERRMQEEQWAASKKYHSDS
jgi:uncharacterized membrane protein